MHEMGLHDLGQGFHCRAGGCSQLRIRFVGCLRAECRSETSRVPPCRSGYCARPRSAPEVADRRDRPGTPARGASRAADRRTGCPGTERRRRCRRPSRPAAVPPRGARAPAKPRGPGADTSEGRPRGRPSDSESPPRCRAGPLRTRHRIRLGTARATRCGPTRFPRRPGERRKISPERPTLASPWGSSTRRCTTSTRAL